MSLRPRRRLLALFFAFALIAAGCTGSDGGDDATDGDGSETTVEGEGGEGGEGTYEATIRRTEGGVPHITADSLANASFGQGYASGEDHTCDLADQVIKVKGERAKWLGPGEDDANIESDVSWRAIGVAEVATADWDEVTPGVNELITAYTDGWNAHLAEVGTDGISGWCAGEPWVQELAPVDVYAYARAVAIRASGGAVAGMLATAQPPSDSAASDEDTEAEGPDSIKKPAPTVDDAGPAVAPAAGSNGWAIGAERSTDGGGMLVGNPHFPWEGELRFWEVHLTVPGEVDIYGVQLSGLPGIGIGFTEDYGWTHTVSAGNRFTAYRLDLVDGDPTKYQYGDEEREITATDLDIEVLGEDGETTTESRTIYRSHYGPMLDFPGFGWTDDGAITYRDANIENDEFIDQYLGTMLADDLDGFIDVHREASGVPLFNTIATSADGRAWYADTSATPNLSDEALAAYETSLTEDPIIKIAADNGAILLDGSDPVNEWEEVDGARDPGLVPFDEMPALERDDYVFNANDSFWLANAEELLEGDYSPLHGRQDTPRSPRTRENAIVLDDATAEGPSGEDGTFTLDELADAAIQNRGYTSRALLDAVVQRCEGAGPISVEPLVDTDDGSELLPAGDVELVEACDVLAGWDGTYDLDQAGPPIWRELMGQYENEDLVDAGPLWAEAFDPADPVATPSGLAPPPDGGSDPLLINLARAVQILDAGDIAVDTPLGDVQVANRNGTLVPIHGGTGVDGTTNVVGYGGSGTVLDPYFDDVSRETLVPGSSLATFEYPGTGEQTGYPIGNGTSFLFALAYTDDGPQAKAFHTYSDTEDREDPTYTSATEAFSAKQWRDVAFTEQDVAATTTDTKTVTG